MRLNPGDRAVSFEPRYGGPIEKAGTRWTLLIFWKTSCSTCEVTFPYLEVLARAYPDLVTCLSVVQGTDEATGANVARQWGATFAVIADLAPYPLSYAYDPSATPTMFLIDNRTGDIEDVLEACIKAELNQLSAKIARSDGRSAVEIAPKGDGNPSWTPG